jgi:alpha-L-fucosidase
MGFRKLRDQQFANNQAIQGKGYFVPHNGSRPAPALNDGNIKSKEILYINYLNSIGIEFEKEQTINCVVIREDLSKGQQCAGFRLLLMNKKHELIREIKGTTIGRKRILTFPETEAAIIGLVVDEQKAPTAISEIEIYHIDPKLIEK